MAGADRIESGWIASILTFVATMIPVATLSLSIAGSARADVDFYIAPQIGISGLHAKTDGFAQAQASWGLRGSDDDASPLIGGSVGLIVPMNELLPREWIEDVRLPSWPVRFELEAAGLRDYDFQTVGAAVTAEVFTSEIKATTLVANTWMDLPLVTAWRPFQYMFGLGRQPRVRQWLEPGSLYFGGGVGFTNLDIKGTDNVYEGKDNTFDFAWNVGAGIGYAITNRVSISTGYRYVSLGPDGHQEIDLIGPSASAGDYLKYELQAHEFRVAVQIKIFSFRGAWR